MPKDAVLFTSRAPVGYCVLAANEICTNQGFKSLILKGGIDPKFIRSYLSTGFLLDPRVFRIAVTTLSSQSIEGTCRELELLGKLAPSSNENEPVPALIFSQVPEDLLKNGNVAKHEERVLESAKLFMESENGDDYLEMPRIVVPFVSTLQVLPNDWAEVMKRISQAGLPQEFRQLVEWLPSITDVAQAIEPEAGTITKNR